MTSLAYLRARRLGAKVLINYAVPRPCICNRNFQLYQVNNISTLYWHSFSQSTVAPYKSKNPKPLEVMGMWIHPPFALFCLVDLSREVNRAQGLMANRNWRQHRQSIKSWETQMKHSLSYSGLPRRTMKTHPISSLTRLNKALSTPSTNPSRRTLSGKKSRTQQIGWKTSPIMSPSTPITSPFSTKGPRKLERWCFARSETKTWKARNWIIFGSARKMAQHILGGRSMVLGKNSTRMVDIRRRSNTETGG